MLQAGQTPHCFCNILYKITLSLSQNSHTNRRIALGLLNFSGLKESSEWSSGFCLFVLLPEFLSPTSQISAALLCTHGRVCLLQLPGTVLGEENVVAEG